MSRLRRLVARLPVSRLVGRFGSSRHCPGTERRASPSKTYFGTALGRRIVPAFDRIAPFGSNTSMIWNGLMWMWNGCDDRRARQCLRSRSSTPRPCSSSTTCADLAVELLAVDRVLVGVGGGAGPSAAATRTDRLRAVSPRSAVMSARNGGKRRRACGMNCDCVAGDRRSPVTTTVSSVFGGAAFAQVGSGRRCCCTMHRIGVAPAWSAP